jgi:dTDP-4-dehydrorhamnose 3,5-epimerase
MKILRSKILKLNLLYHKPFKDNRGLFLETFNHLKINNLFNLNFIEDDITINKKNVFRGIHGDNNTWKLISCINGTITSYVVNCDKNSKKFGIWEKFYLTQENYFQILIPPKYGNAYYVTKNKSIYHYKQTKIYLNSKNQFTYKWYDKRINLDLKNKKLILSTRDK